MSIWWVWWVDEGRGEEKSDGHPNTIILDFAAYLFLDPPPSVISSCSMHLHRYMAQELQVYGQVYEVRANFYKFTGVVA